MPCPSGWASEALFNSKGARHVLKHLRMIKKFVIWATIAVATVGIAPAIAEAQARGMMQVTASVVSTDNALRALEAARVAVRGFQLTASGRRIEAAPTVARVAVAREDRRMVVTIDYSRN
jgi:hypothetical protein